MITPGEAAELNWQDGARRQEVAAWLVRALGVSPVATPQLVRSFLDWPQVAGQYLGEVEALLAMGHLKGVGPGLLAPTQIMKRGELAALLDSVGDEFLPSLGITAGRGQVIDSEEFSSYGQGWGDYITSSPGGYPAPIPDGPIPVPGGKGREPGSEPGRKGRGKGNAAGW